MGRPSEAQSVIQVMGDLRADYKAGQDSRFRSRLTGVDRAGSGADRHYRSEARFLYLMEFSRALDRDDQLVRPGIRRLVDNVIQDGFNVDPQTGDADLDADLKASWQEWSTDPELCHSEGELDFCQMERLVFKSMIVDGDLLVLPLKNGSLQFVEAHRLRTPRGTSRNVVHGILLDDDARRKEYWVTKEDLGPLRSVNLVRDVKQYPARDSEGQRAVWHVYDPDRFSQRRGVPAVAPVGDTAGQHDDLQFAALVAAQLQNCFAILREIEGGTPDIDGQPPLGGQTLNTLADGLVQVLEGVSPGMTVKGGPGEKLRGFSPTIPAPSHFQHSLLLATFVAINLDLPVAVLLLDPSNTNFSGWRGAIDQARITFRRKQRFQSSKFHSPCWRFHVRQRLAREAALQRIAARDGIKLFNHRWNPPTWQYIEPLKDATADLIQSRNALNSHRRLQAQRGRDWDEVSTEIVEDNAMAIEKAIERAVLIKKKHNVEIHWRELLSLPAAEGVRVSIDAAGEAQVGSAGPGRPAEGDSQNRLGSLVPNGYHG